MKSAASLSDVLLERFRTLVRDTCGLEFPRNRRADLERAIDDGVADAGVGDADAFLRLLTDRGDGARALEQWFPMLTIGETHFFRNRPQMQALETAILPELIERRRASRTLRIWSAACSTGEEAYTLAIMLDRLLPDLEQWRVQILATDLDHLHLAKARRGLYGGWSFREVPAGVKEKYFTPQGHQFELDARIRRMVRFEQLNLISDPYPRPVNGAEQFDLVLCRNVLIYFNEQTIGKVLSGLHDSLAPAGWLVVGHAEPSQELFRAFKSHSFPGTVLYQRPGTELPQLVTPLRPAAPASRFEPRPATTSRTLMPTRPPAPRRAPARLRAVPPPPVPTPTPAASGAEVDVAAKLAEIEQLIERGDVDEARRRLEWLVAAAPTEARPPYLLAKLHASRLELQLAERWIDVALERSPLLASAHHLRGLVLQEQGRLDEALEAVRRCVYAEPDFVLGQLALADLFGRLDQQARGAKALENAARLLAGHSADELVPEGDGITVGRLLELVEMRRGLAA